MSKIEVGSKVRFTGFKEQTEVDTASVKELERMFPDFVAGSEVTVREAFETLIYLEPDAEKAWHGLPHFLFPNEVELVD